MVVLNDRQGFLSCYEHRLFHHTNAYEDFKTLMLTQYPELFACMKVSVMGMMSSNKDIVCRLIHIGTEPTPTYYEIWLHVKENEEFHPLWML